MNLPSQKIASRANAHRVRWLVLIVLPMIALPTEQSFGKCNVPSGVWTLTRDSIVCEVDTGACDMADPSVATEATAWEAVGQLYVEESSNSITLSVRSDGDIHADLSEVSP